jgi:hypothetical protein
MKKLLFIVALMMGALVVNAQRTPVKVVELQKAITDNVTKDYVGFMIKEATKVVENNIVTYEVVVAKGTTQETLLYYTLLYDKDGKFLKKLTLKAGTVKKEVVKPTTPPAIKK